MNENCAGVPVEVPPGKSGSFTDGLDASHGGAGLTGGERHDHPPAWSVTVPAANCWKFTRALRAMFRSTYLFTAVYAVTLVSALLPTPTAAGPSLDDFWNGRANFEFVRTWQFPSNDNPVYDYVLYNSQAYIAPVGNIWYRFSREAISPWSGDANAAKPSYCQRDYARFVLHASGDQGATWTSRTVLVDPAPGTPWECAALDGTAYFDAGMKTWHIVFQCLARDGHWAICHALRTSTDPEGPFLIDPRPSVIGGSIVGKIGLRHFFDEGTPQIVEKVGDRFYMTFHAYDGVRGVRAMAWTRNFKDWSVDNTTPLFDSLTCTGWNVAWSGGCIGGGWADVVRIGSSYYMLIEAADENLGGSCTLRKHWVFGLLRTASLTAPAWQPLPGGPGIIFNSAQPYSAGKVLPCGVSYAQLWQSNGDIYLSVHRMPMPEQPEGPATGYYVYKLRTGAPVASYSFEHGSASQQYALSDIISRGNLEATVENVRWLNPGLAIVGGISRVTLPDNAIFKRRAPWSLEANLTLSGAASRGFGAGFIAGDPSAVWLELHQEKTICAWARTPSGPRGACAPVEFNRPEDIIMIVAPNGVTLAITGQTSRTAQVSSVPAITQLTAGTPRSTSGQSYPAWSGTLSRLSFYDYARQF
jgi:hypothetical protein